MTTRILSEGSKCALWTLWCILFGPLLSLTSCTCVNPSGKSTENIHKAKIREIDLDAHKEKLKEIGFGSGDWDESEYEEGSDDCAAVRLEISFNLPFAQSSKGIYSVSLLGWGVARGATIPDVTYQDPIVFSQVLNVPRRLYLSFCILIDLESEPNPAALVVSFDSHHSLEHEIKDNHRRVYSIQYFGGGSFTLIEGQEPIS